jgi:hypothetical protein
MVRGAFNDACDISRYTCRAVPLPVLEVRDLSYWGRGVRGIYAGGPQVYIDDNVKYESPLFKVVLVHEIVHYLQRFAPENDLWQSNCSREGEAFEVAGKYAVKMGWPERDRRSNWWYSYRCNGTEWPEPASEQKGRSSVQDYPIID